MELGARLKQARLEKGLSQRQLCGDEITRNMLSLIENGSAKPSMATLTYLAKRLEKPISYFLEETAQLSPNQDCMVRARSAYAAGEYRQVLEILELYSLPDPICDPERWLLESLSLQQLAALSIREDKTVFARELLKKAAAAEEKTIYATPASERERLLLQYMAEPESAAQIHEALPEDPREAMLRAEAYLQREDYARAAQVLDSVQTPADAWHLLKARAAMGQGDHAGAISHLLAAESVSPLYCAKALEECYLAVEDYKMAYHYACKQRSL